MSRIVASVACMLPLMGCSFLPEVAYQPVVLNPFPQLSKIAVAPFFNLSAEPTVDGRQFALAYYNELQLIPGFEVLPVGVVESAMKQYGIPLAGPQDARRLAEILGVDVVVIGAVTDFSPYYPPRCGLQVEWYAANPCFHPIPPGYGLPFGTPAEEDIPPRLVYEAEFAAAKAELDSQSPHYKPLPPPQPPQASGADNVTDEDAEEQEGVDEQDDTTSPFAENGKTAAFPSTANGIPPIPASLPSAETVSTGETARQHAHPDSHDKHPHECDPTDEPVLTHTNTYNGHDAKFTQALANYDLWRDDARFGGYEAYLQRSDDFIRFCCYLHMSEMLTARGGAGETRVVWHWPRSR